jgi:hypothetical protein
MLSVANERLRDCSIVARKEATALSRSLPSGIGLAGHRARVAAAKDGVERSETHCGKAGMRRGSFRGE